jgi:hypothetical protein
MSVAEMTMDRCAELSPCGRYRYRLSRTWSDRPPVTFVMLNPSTADATSDDPTIRRCTGYAQNWGYGGLIVVNLYALRATDPDELWRVEDPIGPVNDDHLREAFGVGGPIVAAWGCHGRPSRIDTVLSYAPTLTALALTKSGQPGHPLYLPAAATPFRWR